MPGMDDIIRGAAAAKLGQPSMAPAVPASPGAPAPPAAPARPAFSVSLPGHQAPAHEWNYEPQSDRAWKIYPPGIAAHPHAPQATMPTPAGPEHLREIAMRLSQLPARRRGQVR
jgi:hypothetical protein